MDDDSTSHYSMCVIQRNIAEHQMPRGEHRTPDKPLDNTSLRLQLGHQWAINKEDPLGKAPHRLPWSNVRVFTSHPMHTNFFTLSKTQRSPSRVSLRIALEGVMTIRRTQGMTAMFSEYEFVRHSLYQKPKKEELAISR